MNSPQTTTRHPWCALALSFLATGLGHIYCGRTGKGLILFCAWLLIPVAAMAAALLRPTTAVLVMLILVPMLGMIGLYLYAALNAWVRRATDRRQLQRPRLQQRSRLFPVGRSRHPLSNGPHHRHPLVRI